MTFKNTPSENFPEIFAAAWANPTLDSLMAPLRDEVVLVQPLSRDLFGKAEARKTFAKTLKRFPGVCGTVHGHAISDDLHLYIDWTLRAPIGGRMIAVPIIDKFWFLDGLVSKRIAYFDPAPIIKATLKSPRQWLRVLSTL